MTKTILMLTASFLLLTSGAFAQQSQPADDAAVKQVVQYYFDGWTKDDVASLKKAFSPKAKWFHQTNTGELQEVKISDVFKNVVRYAGQNASSSRRTFTRILTTDVTGDTAAVKVEFEYPDSIQGSASLEEAKQKKPGVKQTEYLSLLKFKDGWQIVSKVFVLQSTSTASQQTVSIKQ